MKIRYIFTTLTLSLFALTANATLIGTNLVANSDAETNNTSGWAGDTGVVTVSAQNAGSNGLVNGIGEIGNYVFSGGTGLATDSMYQRFDLTSLASDIANSAIEYDFSALLQSRSGSTGVFDKAIADLSFFDSADNLISSIRLEDTSYVNFAWEYFGQQGVLPTNTTTAEVKLILTRNGGGSSDGMIDNISLVLNRDGQQNPSPVSEPQLLWLLGSGFLLLLARRRKI